MNLGKALRSLFKGSDRKQEAGWSFTVQAHTDLKRQIVYVHVADEAKAEAIALEAVVGLVTARQAVPESVLADLGVPPGQHKRQAGHGWSFSVQGPPGGENPLVFVYLSDEAEAEAVARKAFPGTILQRSKVPPGVIAGDLAMPPGSCKVLP